jgi:glycosyltransferase 2 family protein
LTRSQKAAVGVLISALFCWLAFSGIDGRKVVELARSLDPLRFSLAMALFMATMLVRSYRFWLLTGGASCAGYSEMFLIFNVGAFATYVLPFRLGEFSRPIMLREIKGASFSSTLAAVVVERVFDGMIHMLFLGTVLLAFEVPRAVKLCGLAAGLVYGTALFAIVLLRSRPEMARRFVKKLPLIGATLAERISGTIGSFAEGASNVRGIGALSWITLVSALAWGVSLLSTMMAFHAIGLPYGIAEVMLLMVFITFGMMIPAGPGFVGTYHYALVVGMTFLGTSRETAIGAAILVHFFNVAFLVSVGLVSLWAIGIKFGSIVEES